MKHKFIVQSSNNLTSLPNYFDFNGIEYTLTDFFQPGLDTGGRYQIPEDTNGPAVLVMDSPVFEDLIAWNVSRERLLKWIHNGNKIVFYQDSDAGCRLELMEKTVTTLDSEILPGSLMYVLDSQFPKDHWTNGLKKSLVRQMPLNMYMRISRLHCTGSAKNPDAHPYMVTTIVRKHRPHRMELLNQLTARKSLFDQGLCIFHQNVMGKYPDTWHGSKPKLHDWYDGYPSMELYKNAYIEVVPETVAGVRHFFTEKTAKPMSTKTPFLMVSSMGYLNYLRSLGFRTFDHLISEQYDLELRVEDRIRLVIDQLDDIVKNGASDFYLSCQDVLEHNQRRLAEITGMWDLCVDDFWTQCLQEIDQ